MRLRCKSCGNVVQVTKGGLVNPCRKCLNVFHARGVRYGIEIESLAGGTVHKKCPSIPEEKKDHTNVESVAGR